MGGEEEKQKHIFWFEELGIDDVATVGGKNASLGEMYQELTPKGVKIPHGFAVTADAYRYFLKFNGIDGRVKEILKDLDVNDILQLQSCGYQVRNTILSKPFPDDLAEAIIEAYQKLEKEYNPGVDVAVRSSATAEDLPDASFAGQQETFLNVTGVEALLDSCKKCMASLFTNRAISYRELKKYDHFSVGLSIGVQKMVRSDLASSGVMFSLDTESGFQDVVLLSGSWGLGENIVQGAVNPDEWHIFKPTLKQGFEPIVEKKLGSKEVRMVYSNKLGEKTKNLATSEAMRGQFCLNNVEVLQLAEWACLIEDHYSTKRNTYMPMDMEWAKDGITNQLFIVQARPETVHSQKDKTKLQTFSLNEDKKNLKLLCSGAAVGSQIGSGEASIIRDLSLMSTFKKGQILVTEMTDPDWEPILKQASGVVTNRGGRTCHAAIISRELGIPCVVGCGDATLSIVNGKAITVDSSQGEEGCVWEGDVPFVIDEQDLTVIPKLKTKIAINLGNPDKAYENSFLPNDGVGLARMEFIVSNHIRVHPLACLHPEKVTNPNHLEQIQHIIKGYSSASNYFIEKLAQGLAMISAAFYPKKVILRFSDFKTNEYVNLVGGNDFEPKEENPMLGWRGASRYYDPCYKEGFALECEAVKKVRQEFGLTNLEVMIPFVRTVAEAKRVLKEMEINGLKQGENGLRVIGMCEIPANVILADEFLDVFDGFSIGSNDLTQLTLGLDRDSERVRHLYDERNPAIKKLVAQVIEVALRKGKYIGICGQAPSDFPEFAKFLVENRIESMSLNPDSILKTIVALAETEKELGL